MRMFNFSEQFNMISFFFGLLPLIKHLRSCNVHRKMWRILNLFSDEFVIATGTKEFLHDINFTRINHREASNVK